MVWVAVALSILQAMREAREQDKADTVPTLFVFNNFNVPMGNEGHRKCKNG